jgi:hypothetical protein
MSWILFFIEKTIGSYIIRLGYLGLLELHFKIGRFFSSEEKASINWAEFEGFELVAEIDGLAGVW